MLNSYLQALVHSLGSAHWPILLVRFEHSLCRKVAKQCIVLLLHIPLLMVSHTIFLHCNSYIISQNILHYVPHSNYATHSKQTPCGLPKFMWASHSFRRQSQRPLRSPKAHSTETQAWLNWWLKLSCRGVTPPPLGKVSWAKLAEGRQNHPTEKEACRSLQMFQSKVVKEFIQGEGKNTRIVYLTCSSSNLILLSATPC